MCALLTKHKAGESLRVGKDTLGVFIDEWLDAQPDLKESSVTHYRRNLNLYACPKLGNKLLAKIEAGDIQSLYEYLTESGLSRSTVSFVHTLLKGIFKLAMRRRKIPHVGNLVNGERC